jgi:uncharacterized protein (TIGR02285 family)
MLKTPSREKNFIFSHPTALYIGLRVYSKTQIDIKEPIDLIELSLRNKNKTFGIPFGKRYDIKIEKQLDLISKQKIVNTSTNNLTELKMFNANRFNYMLGYPSTVNSLWPKISDNQVYSYEVKGAEGYVLSHLMCSKTESNAAFIKAFNTSLKVSYKNKAFFDIQYQSISIDNQKDFIKYFKQAFEAY